MIDLFRQKVTTETQHKTKSLADEQTTKVLKPFFTKITHDGEVQINFTEEIFSVPDLELINSGTVLVDDKVVPVLALDLVKAEDSNERKQILSWEVISQTSRQLRIKVKLDGAMFVSLEGEPDLIRATFNDPLLFTARSGVQIKEENKVISKELPPQLPKEYSTWKKFADSFFYSADTLTVLEFTLHTLIKIPLNQLLSMINTLQIIVLFSVFKIQLPANAGIFFNQMQQIAAYDFYDTGNFIDSVLGLESDGRVLNSNFETLGFESLFVLHNLGTLICVFVYYPVAILFTWLCSKCTCSYEVSTWGKKK